MQTDLSCPAFCAGKLPELGAEKVREEMAK
jgi:hypothetical protein